MTTQELVEETCPLCGWKFKDATYTGTREMLRDHMNTEHRWVAVLVCGRNEEKLAKEAGWAHNEIVIAELSKLQGRRYHDLYIPWSVMYDKWNGELMNVLNNNQTAMGGTIHIVGSIPQRKDIK